MLSGCRVCLASLSAWLYREMPWQGTIIIAIKGTTAIRAVGSRVRITGAVGVRTNPAARTTATGRFPATRSYAVKLHRAVLAGPVGVLYGEASPSGHRSGVSGDPIKGKGTVKRKDEKMRTGWEMDSRFKTVERKREMKRVIYAASLTWLIALAIGLAVPASSWASHHHYCCYNSVRCLIHQLRYTEDEDDREDAAEELGKIGDPRALPALRAAAAFDDEKDVRKEARKAIRRIVRGRQHRRYACDHRRPCTCYQSFPGDPVVCRRPAPCPPYMPYRPSCRRAVSVWTPYASFDGVF